MKNTFAQTNITGGFWKTMQDKNRTITMPAVYDRFTESGHIQAMRCTWKEGMDKQPHFYWDSDVAKWLEGAAYVLAKHRDAELERKVESIIDDIEAAQGEDGYYNIYFTVVEPQNRWKGRTNHELYCAGHLMEAAVAYYEATGKDRFLRCMKKYADYIYKVFVEEKSAAFVTPGHEEIEIALLRLYRCCGEAKYLELCRFFIEERGRHREETYGHVNEKYAQHDVPVREFTQAEGHAVRAMYLYTAMADLAQETQDEELMRVCKQLFADVVQRKMCITGGIGASFVGEAFTIPYDLPNDTAYNETCASIGLAFFADKLLEQEKRSVYADAIERVLYNGMLSGLSLSGDSFFYENPLEIHLRDHARHTSVNQKDRLPITRRQRSFWCSCCPPNLNRVLASVEKYIYARKDDVYYVHQYMESVLDDGACRIEQKTNYPVNGHIALRCENVPMLAIRIPGWCREFRLNAPYEMRDGYAYVKQPSELVLELVMQPVLYAANRRVKACANKVALALGPVVYCVEGVDNPGELHDLYIERNARFQTAYSEVFGLHTITAQGFKRRDSDALYAPVEEDWEATQICFIPFYAFANREECDMIVWLNAR